MREQNAYLPHPIESKQIESLETKTYYDNVSMDSVFGAGVQGELGAFLNAVIAYYLFAVCDSVHTAVTIVSDEFSQIRPVLQDKKTEEYITDHPALELLESNDMRFNETQVKKELMVSYMASGECFPVIGGNVNYEPVSLFHYPACNVSVVQAGDGYIANILASYQNVITNFTRAQTSPIYKNLHTYVFEDQPKLGQMMHILSNRRRNYLRAQSDLESIYYQATMKFYTQMHNSGIVKNGSRPSGIWSPKVPLSDDGYTAFRDSVKSGFTGPDKAGKNIISSFPVDYVNLLLTNRDMDFEKLINQADMDVYNTFRIPLPLITTSTMTMNNYANAIYALFDMAVLPKAKFLFKNLGDFILARYKDGSRYRLCIDDREIPALKQRLLERGQAMRNIYGFTENEIRGEVGYKPREDGLGETIYIPATYVDSAQPVMDYQSNVNDPNNNIDNMDDDIKKKRLSFKADDEGEWVTINGQHVLINKQGDILKGPQSLKDKKSLEKWTSDSKEQAYINIRKASIGESKDESAIRDAENIEHFIENSEKYNGLVARGIKGETIDHFEIGSEIDMKGISSWSSDRGAAASFVDKTGDRKGNILFNIIDSSKGVDISKYSISKENESEIIFSAKQKFVVDRITSGHEGNIFCNYVFLKEK